tara:strand:- start:1376 stop:2365 length:990 start_codon:yes stop_codon:yes gene_type:complete
MRESKEFRTAVEKKEPRRSAWSFVSFDDCKKGETSAKTGCTPQSGEGGKKEGEGPHEYSDDYLDKIKEGFSKEEWSGAMKELGSANKEGHVGEDASEYSEKAGATADALSAADKYEIDPTQENFDEMNKKFDELRQVVDKEKGEGEGEGKGSYEGYRSLEKKLKEAQKAQGNLNDAWMKLDENDFESIQVPGFGRMSKDEVEKKADEYDQLVDETFEKRDEFRDSLSPEDRERVEEEDNKQEKAEEAEEDLLEEGRKVPMPRSIESLKNHPWVDEVSDERDDGNGVWAYLKKSLWNESDDTSFVNGENFRDVLRQWRDMKVTGRSKREG